MLVISLAVESGCALPCPVCVCVQQSSRLPRLWPPCLYTASTNNMSVVVLHMSKLCLDTLILQLGQVLRVYEEVSVRYSQLAHSTVQAGLALCREGDECDWFCVNLWMIIVNKAVIVDRQTL